MYLYKDLVSVCKKVHSEMCDMVNMHYEDFNFFVSGKRAIPQAINLNSKKTARVVKTSKSKQPMTQKAQNKAVKASDPFLGWKVTTKKVVKNPGGICQWPQKLKDLSIVLFCKGSL